MLFNVKSHIDFPTQKAIYFKNMNFTVAGTGDFTGTFRFWKTGAGSTARELKGTFASAIAGVNAWRFSRRARLAALEQLGVPRDRRDDGALWRTREVRLPDGAARQAGHADDGDLGHELHRRQSARADGLPRVEGHPSRGTRLGAQPPRMAAGQVLGEARVGTRDRADARRADADDARRQRRADRDGRSAPPEYGPFNSQLPLGYVPIAGSIDYTLDPDWITLAPGGWAATQKTYVEFSGRTAWSRAIRDPVSREQPRLARERSAARRAS
jgi:hypothetical protein